MKIGELAARGAVSVQTVRFYERKGLLEPPTRSSGGFRLYEPEVVDRLLFIRDGQELGFTLAEISELLSLRAENEASCEQIRIVANKRIEALEAKIQQLERMRATLHRLASVCPGDAPAGECPVITFLEVHDEAP